MNLACLQSESRDFQPQEGTYFIAILCLDTGIDNPNQYLRIDRHQCYRQGWKSRKPWEPRHEFASRFMPGCDGTTVMLICLINRRLFSIMAKE